LDSNVDYDVGYDVSGYEGMCGRKKRSLKLKAWKETELKYYDMVAISPLLTEVS
jgi:hypothetical protein